MMIDQNKIMTDDQRATVFLTTIYYKPRKYHHFKNDTRKRLQKLCPSCSKNKWVYQFGKNIGRYDGLQGFCKMCHAAATKRSKYRIYDK